MASYVDDFMLYLAGSRLQLIERSLQMAINKITTWTSDHGFTFSASKTVSLTFHQKRYDYRASLTLYNEPITAVKSAKFLGIIFDVKLTWIPHLKNLRDTATKPLQLLRLLSHLRWGSDRKTMLRIYESVLLSKLNYGSHLYSSAKPKKLLRMLEPIQNEALRLATGAFKSSPIPSLQVETNFMPLNSRRELLTLQYYFRCQQLPSSEICGRLLSEADDITPHSII